MDRHDRRDVSVTIAAVRARAPYAEALAAAIPFARVVYDDPPSGSSWPNYRAVLAAAGAQGETWTVSLDDDAVLCEDFPAQLAAALAACPGDFAGFYMSHKPEMARARASGACWFRTIRVVHGIGWAIRSALAAKALQAIDHGVPAAFVSGDQRLQYWLTVSGRWNFITVPNLIDHRPELVGLQGVRKGESNRKRRSGWFEPRPLARPWSGACVTGSFTRSNARRLMAERGLQLLGRDEE